MNIFSNKFDTSDRPCVISLGDVPPYTFFLCLGEFLISLVSATDHRCQILTFIVSFVVGYGGVTLCFTNKMYPAHSLGYTPGMWHELWEWGHFIFRGNSGSDSTSRNLGPNQQQWRHKRWWIGLCGSNMRFAAMWCVLESYSWWYSVQTWCGPSQRLCGIMSLLIRLLFCVTGNKEQWLIYQLIRLCSLAATNNPIYQYELKNWLRGTGNGKESESNGFS